MPGLFSTHRLMKWLPGVLLPSFAAMRVDGVSIPSRISGGHRRPRRNSVKPVVPLLGVIWLDPGWLAARSIRSFSLPACCSRCSAKCADKAVPADRHAG